MEVAVAEQIPFTPASSPYARPPTAQQGGILGLLVRLVYVPAAMLFGTLGLRTPASRAIVGALMGYAIQGMFQPGSAYTHDSEGKMERIRPWAFSKAGRNDPDATLMPWFMYPLIGSFTFGVLF